VTIHPLLHRPWILGSLLAVAIVLNAYPSFVLRGQVGAVVECGDGVLKGAEQCEIGVACDAGQQCVPECQCIPSGSLCGNGVCDAGESRSDCPQDCDDTPIPFGDSAVSSTAASGTCGDGIVEGLEQCEQGISCADSTKQCDLATCQCFSPAAPASSVSSVTPVCGNWILEPGEDCEVGVCCPSGQTCGVSTCQCH